MIRVGKHFLVPWKRELESIVLHEKKRPNHCFCSYRCPHLRVSCVFYRGLKVRLFGPCGCMTLLQKMIASTENQLHTKSTHRSAMVLWSPCKLGTEDSINQTSASYSKTCYCFWSSCKPVPKDDRIHRKSTHRMLLCCNHIRRKLYALQISRRQLTPFFDKPAFSRFPQIFQPR